MTDFLKRIDTKVIYPIFLEKVKLLIANCQARGVDYWAISGYRTWAEQDALFAQGRDKNGTVVDKIKVVTNARGGQSNHNYTIAVDFCPDKDKTRDGLQPDWNDAAYVILAEEAAKIPGLESGRNWKFKDNPHVQLHLALHGLDFPNLKAEYLKKKDIKDIWALLDKYSW